jgi:simple sugar transport system ATP-binding protein
MEKSDGTATNHKVEGRVIVSQDPGAATHATTQATGEPVLEARAIVKRYGHVEAIRGANFCMRAGEVVALVGDNGAGKTTLIKILSGALQPDGGEILYCGRRVTLASPIAARRLGIETVYQDLALGNVLDPAANLFMGRELTKGRPLGWFGFTDKREMRRQTAAAFERLGINIPASTRSVAELSGGQRQGVAVARAVTWASKAIFLDEPTAALAAMQTSRVLELVRRVADQGLAVTLISHDLPQVLEVADRVEVLRLGRRVASFSKNEASAELLLAAMTGAFVQDETL